MKSLNKTLGVLSLVVLVTGVLFKMMHWPGASVLLTIAILAIGVFFILYLVKALSSPAVGLERWSGITGALMMIIGVTGFVFKANHWPGAGIILLVSHVVMIITGIVILLDSLKEEDNAKGNIKILLAYFILIMSATVFLTGLWKDVL